jgi:predicted metal-dependent HD superfamily phosphohydrolase
MEYRGAIRDFDCIVLATIFHDIVYDARSKTNEEDSADLLKHLISNHLPGELLQKAADYIIATKAHAVEGSDDNDLKLFIDFDMSILGSESTVYKIYASKIRQEYIHVEEVAYCNGRSQFLRHTIANGSSIFATEEFRRKYETIARENMEWEAGLLEQGQIPTL